MPFGYGFGGLPTELAGNDRLKFYLAAPLTIYLGTEDNKPDRYFDRKENAMKQGPGRYQRGHACFEMAKELAADRGWDFRWKVKQGQPICR